MVSKSDIKERIKETPLGIWFLAIFLMALGLCIYIPRYMINGTFTVGANTNYSTETLYFEVPWNKYLQIICLGPVFGIVYYTLMRAMLSKVDKSVGKNRYYVYLIEIGVVIFIALCSMAHLAHLGFEEANAIDASKGAALNSEYVNMFVYTWYMDEWLGHTLGLFCYFMYLVLAVLAEQLITDHKKMQPQQILLIIIGAFIIGVMDGQIAISSECAFFLLVSHLTFTVIAIIIVIAKKIRLFEHPLLLTMILSLIPVLFFNVQFILENGIKDFYPFYSGNLF